MILFWSYTSGFSILLPLAVWLFRFGFRSTPAGYLFAYLLVFSVVELTGVLLAYYRLNNIWLACLFIPLEVWLLTNALARWMKRPMQKQIMIMVGLSALCSLVDAFFICKLQSFNAFSRITSSLLLLIAALMAFYDLLENLQEDVLVRSSLFWLAVAMLLYYAVNLTLFVVKSYDPLRLGPRVSQMWLLHSALNIAFNLLLVKVILCLPTTVTKSS